MGGATSQAVVARQRCRQQAILMDNDAIQDAWKPVATVLQDAVRSVVTQRRSGPGTHVSDTCWTVAGYRMQDDAAMQDETMLRTQRQVSATDDTTSRVQRTRQDAATATHARKTGEAASCRRIQLEWCAQVRFY